MVWVLVIKPDNNARVAGNVKGGGLGQTCGPFRGTWCYHFWRAGMNPINCRSGNQRMHEEPATKCILFLESRFKKRSSFFLRGDRRISSI